MTTSRERRVLTTGDFREMPPIVCLCGSTRFYEYFQRARQHDIAAHRLLVVHGESVGCSDAQKIALDELHKRKIDLADEVLVLNVAGYIGESTRSEIEYAESLGMRVRYLEPR